jgi:DNA-binding PadR family transcriptional regulator
MKVPSIGKTEVLILAALSKERYGLEIIDEVCEITDSKQKLSLGGLYTTLHRMEEKGLVESRWGEPTEERQGARRKYYKSTGLGIKALKEATRLYKAIVDYGFNPAFTGAL